MTIALDFDGVIHRYSKGWQNGEIYDDMIEGTKEFIEAQFAAGNSVVVISTRDPDQIVPWLARELWTIPVVTLPDGEKFWNTIGVVAVTNRKIPAFMYIDDRAYKFEGSFPDTSDFKTWQQ